MVDKEDGPFLKKFKELANRPRWVASAYVLTPMAGGLIFYLLEGMQRGLGLVRCLYWGAVTFATVGFGDVSPTTDLGMIFTAVFILLSLLVLAQVIGKFASEAIRTIHQYTHHEQEWTEDALQAIAMRLGVELPPPPSDTDFGNIEPGAKS